MSGLWIIEKEIKSRKYLSDEAWNYLRSIKSTEDVKELCELLLKVDVESRKNTAYENCIDFLGPPGKHFLLKPEKSYTFDLFLNLVISEGHRYVNVFTKAKGKSFLPLYCLDYLSRRDYSLLMPFLPFRTTEERVREYYVESDYGNEDKTFDLFLKDGICADSLKLLNSFVKRENFFDQSESRSVVFYLNSVWQLIGEIPSMTESKDSLYEVVCFYKLFIRQNHSMNFFYFDVSKESQILTWLAICGSKSLLLKPENEINELLYCKFRPDFRLTEFALLTPSQRQFDEYIKRALVSSLFNSKVKSSESIRRGFACLHEDSKAEVLTLFLKAIDDKAFDFKTVSEFLYLDYFNGRPKFFAKLLCTSMFKQELSLLDQMKCLDSFDSVGTDRKDVKERRFIVDLLWSMDMTEHAEKFLRDLVEQVPLEARFFESWKLLDKKNWDIYVENAPLSTQLRLVLPDFPSILESYAKKSNSPRKVLRILRVFEKAGLKLFASDDERRRTFKWLTSDKENETALSIAAWFFVNSTENSPHFESELLRLANNTKLFSLKLILTSRMSDARMSIDFFASICEDNYFLKLEHWNEFSVLCWVKSLANIDLDEDHKKLLRVFFDKTSRFDGLEYHEILCIKELAMREFSSPILYSSLKKISSLDDKAFESLSYLIDLNWEYLDERRVKKVILDRLLISSPKFLVCWLPVICKGLESFPDERKLIEQLIAKVVSSAVYRTDVLCVAQSIPKLGLSPVVVAQLAAHWFLVDTMIDFCESYSSNVFIHSLILGCYA
jgi:hypothetical protein